MNQVMVKENNHKDELKELLKKTISNSKCNDMELYEAIFELFDERIRDSISAHLESDLCFDISSVIQNKDLVIMFLSKIIEDAVKTEDAAYIRDVVDPNNSLGN